jgi:hypothetical protein
MIIGLNILHQLNEDYKLLFKFFRKKEGSYNKNNIKIEDPEIKSKLLINLLYLFMVSI